MNLQEQRARSLLKRLDKVNWDMDLIESEGLPELDEEDNIQDIAREQGVDMGRQGKENVDE